MRLATTNTMRRGFTLLEVLLAMAVGVLLLGGLYVAVDVQLRHVQAGRDLVEQSTVARVLLTRIGNDILITVNLDDPGRYRNANQSSGSGGGGGGGSGGGGMGNSSPSGATGATGTTSSGGTTGGTGSGSSSQNSNGSNGANTVTLPLGIQGDSGQINLYASKLPRELLTAAASDTPPVVSDLRRISYWLVGGSDNASGLAKQEVKVATSPDATDTLPPGLPNEESYIIADEVRSLQFQYFDGTSWQDSWDGTQLGADGITPVGPPRAVAITIGMVRPGAGPDALVKTYRHVVAIPTANGTTQQTTGSGTSP